MGHVAILPDDVRVVRHTEVIEMLEAGMPIKEIAFYCDVTPQTIHYQLRQMGLRYSRTKGWQNGNDPVK
jgi:hypothetical protein